MDTIKAVLCVLVQSDVLCKNVAQAHSKLCEIFHAVLSITQDAILKNNVSLIGLTFSKVI